MCFPKCRCFLITDCFLILTSIAVCLNDLEEAIPQSVGQLTLTLQRSTEGVKQPAALRCNLACPHGSLINHQLLTTFPLLFFWLKNLLSPLSTVLPPEEKPRFKWVHTIICHLQLILLHLWNLNYMYFFYFTFIVSLSRPSAPKIPDGEKVDFDVSWHVVLGWWERK